MAKKIENFVTKEEKKKYLHLNYYARDRLEALLGQKHSQSEVAEVLGVHKSTISREIQRHKLENGGYKADVAEHKAGITRSNSKYQGMKIEADPELKERIIKGMKAGQSPDGIAGRMKMEKQETTISTASTYRWLYSPFGQQYCPLLCTKRYKKKKWRTKPKREMIKNMKTIRHIPEETINGGNMSEADTFLSPKRARTTTAVVVVVKQRSKYISGNKIPSMEVEYMTLSMQRIQEKHPSDALIMDRGIENRGHEEYGVPSYFCDPHAPWEKPLVEGTIGLSRRWFWPKGTSLDTVSEEELQEGFRILNSKYRKSLHYRSASEVEEEYEKYDMIERLTATRVALH